MSTYKFNAPEGKDKLHLFLTFKAAKLLEKQLRKAVSDKQGFWVVTSGELSTEGDKPAPRAKRKPRKA